MLDTASPIVITNCKKPTEAALKVFVFFLISQPLIYLLESPFVGLEVFYYYPRWFIYTLLTLPGGYVAWYITKRNWLSAVILSVASCGLTIMGTVYTMVCIDTPPRHLLSAIFCFVVAVLLPTIFLSNSKKRFLPWSIVVVTAFALPFIIYQRGGVSYSSSYPLPVSVESCQLISGGEYATLEIQDSSIEVTFNSPGEKSAVVQCVEHTFGVRGPATFDIGFHLTKDGAIENTCESNQDTCLYSY